MTVLCLPDCESQTWTLDGDFKSTHEFVCLLRNTALITITCLYTAGSSISEFPVSPCQHINLHRCIYHRTHMLTPT